MDRKKVKKTARAYLLSIAAWCALSLLTGWQYRLFDKSLKINSSLLDMVLLAEARGFSFALLTPPIFYLVRHHTSRKRSTIWYAVAYGLGIVPFMLLYAGIHWLLCPPWDPVLQAYVPRAGHSPLDIIRSSFADQVTIYIAILVAAHAYKYLERLRKHELEGFEYQQALAASELQALKMQIHPHFLFNTLHGISTLIDKDRNIAKAMVVKMSRLLRTALEHGSSDLISLDDELKFATDYLDLEKMRLGDRLRVEWSIDPETRALLVPQMILQPLVENAIRHGAACSREGGWVEIASNRSKDKFEVRITNSVGSRRPAGTGIGLRNTSARIRYLYGDEAAFNFAIGDDATATARLVLPALGSQVDGQEPPEGSTFAEAGDHARIDRR